MSLIHDSRKLYDVDKVYNFRDQRIDAALIILKDPVKDIDGESNLTGTIIDGSNDSIDENHGYYSIGYGDPTTFDSNNTLPGYGWNTKKATRISYELFENNLLKELTAECGVDGNFASPIFGICAGPSQSGAPIINAKTHKVKGVFTGGFNISVPSIFNKIVKACDQYILEKKQTSSETQS